MQMINVLFLKITGMGLMAGIVITVVLFVRLLLRGLPKNFAYILWIAVAFRLVVPVTADADISIFNLFTGKDIGSEIGGITNIPYHLSITDKNLSDSLGGQAAQGYVQNSAANNEADIKGATGRNTSKWTGASYDRSHSAILAISIMSLVWIAGILALVSCTAIAYVRIRRKIRYSILLYDNVYECDGIRSPFVLGVFSPRIYLPFRLSGTERQCVLAHERYHIRRRDYLVKSFAYALVIVYWFQPLVWIAYRLMCIDMEMSCDEKVIFGFTVEMRKEYSRLLLAFAANKRQNAVSPLAFGEENTMKRIKNILNYKKPAQWRLVVGAAVIVLTMAACATDASTDQATAPVTDAAGILNLTDVSENVVDSTDVTVHDYWTNDHHSIEHQPAQWAENSMFDLELCSLDYADSDKIVFHISSGLFEYDLKKQKIIHSIDLKALNCQAVQTGGECRVSVYQNSDSQLRAVMIPYPYSDENGYVYDLESDELSAYDASLLGNYVLFDGFASKYDLTDEKKLGTWRAAGNVVPLDDFSYGALYWETICLDTMYYEAGEQKWQLFHKEQATLPRLLKQDDSFYQSFAMISGETIDQCVMDYTGFYNSHDYAGVCALSTGVEYSDALQEEWLTHTDELTGGIELSHTADETKYVFQFTHRKHSGAEGEPVNVIFTYIEGQGWRADGLPDYDHMLYIF